jgi:hypothetical protein
MKKLISMIIAGTAMIVSAPSAQAETITVTYTGFFAYGTDFTGLFGVTGGQNGNLSGDTYTAIYQFDSTRGTLVLGLNNNSLSGGSYLGVSSPLIDASVSVNGVSVSLGGSFYSYVKGSNEFGFAQQGAEADEFKFGGYNWVQNQITDFYDVLPIEITKSFTYSGGAGSGYLQLFTPSGAVGASGVLNPTSLSISVSAALGPQPGAGLAGLALMSLAGLYVKSRRI